ncbi:indole-3-glycerol phosphate synthase TrpC [Bryobacter aggregatus]|uniref:indole-3-glycerol phosphate synthase TrpC n=1 Tax=Bryobacter aggregatus TaxID=360054 RepID=UPI0004E22E89|nr:indole-3-glycerol phosphate synthase TrpC [Bryobacter aggregatus]
MSVPDILAKIVDRKKQELVVTRAQLVQLEARAADNVGKQRGFGANLRRNAGTAVIAEVKKASPSRGLLRESFDPPQIARDYEAGGASAISVLTDRDFFQGSLEDLAAARNAVKLPVLRKDFTLEETQIVEAAAWGADAILLIAALLDAASLRRLREFAESLGLDALVEVHDAQELEQTIDSGATIIGVNNRNLRTFTVTLETSLALASQMPQNALKVSESGIFTRAHIETLREAGYAAFLIGESLMKSGDASAALTELTA